jgi:phosphoribosylamine--glycine ligase
MGSLSLPGPTLPFMTPSHYEEACAVIQLVIDRLGEQGRHFSGVMNSGFFATSDGIRVIEFNARFGDPECMNIMTLFTGSWPETMERIVSRRLAPSDVPLAEQASVVLYLVSPDYALRPGRTYEFTLDRLKAEAEGCHVFFSSAVQSAENTYRTVGTSRAVALATSAPTLEEARALVASGAARVPVLQWRADVGDEAYLNGLAELVPQ